MDQYRTTGYINGYILRTRARYGPALFRRVAPPLLYLSEAIFPRQLLHGIKRRAERGKHSR